MHLKETINKIRRIRHFNKIAGGVVGAALIFWGVAVWVFSDSYIGTDKTAQQVEQLADNIRRYYQNRPDFWGLNTQTVIEKKIAPQKMIKNGRLLSYFGTEVIVGQGEEGVMLMPGARNFDITLSGLNYQQCRELASFRFKDKFWLGVVEVSINNGKTNETFNWNSEKNMLPIKSMTADKLCGKNNAIRWHYG